MANSVKIRMTGVTSRMRLSGWGRYPYVEASVLAPRDADSTAQILKNGEGPRMIPRGAGRSYGDSALAAFDAQDSAAGGPDGIINLSNLDGSNGFLINGTYSRDYSGYAVAAAGEHA